MEHESQSYTITDRCHRNNTDTAKKLVKGNRHWNSDNRVAANSSYTLPESSERFLRFKDTSCYWNSRT